MSYGELFKNAITGKNFMRSVIALIVCTTGAAFIFMAVFGTVPKENVETRNMSVAFVFGVLTTVIGYYFGTSQSSSEKNEIIKSDKTSNSLPSGEGVNK